MKVPGIVADAVARHDPGVLVQAWPCLLEPAAAVDHARKPVRHDAEQPRDAGQQEHRRDRELDRMRNCRQCLYAEHGRNPPSKPDANDTIGAPGLRSGASRV